MEFNDVLNAIITQGPFAVLFVWLLYSTRSESREREARLIEESRARETKLYEIIEQVTEKYDIIVERLDRLEARIK